MKIWGRISIILLEILEDIEYTPFRKKRRCDMQINVALEPIVSLVAGILILFIPKLLNYIVAIYLIVIGILGVVR